MVIEMIVYKITNNINGKVYIGQTTRSLSYRWSCHCTLTSHCHAINAAIKKYGKENFTVEQIDVAATREELDQKEIFWIKHYDSMSPNGYNLHSGGEHHEVSEETRQKISNANKGRKLSEECRLKISKAHKGRRRTVEQRKKLSEHWKEQWKNVDFANKMSKIRKEFCNNPEWKNKVSNSLKGKFLGGNSPLAKKILCVETNVTYSCASEAMRLLNVCDSSIRLCCNGKYKTAGGYHWRYL